MQKNFQPKPPDDHVVEILKNMGIKLEPAPRFPILMWARLSLQHLAFGCQKVRHFVWDEASQRGVEVGRICTICGKEYPL